jgi:hypothetical protein
MQTLLPIEHDFFSQKLCCNTSYYNDTCNEDLQGADVICGRDKFAQTYIGNRRFLDIIQSFREEYTSVSKRENKTLIIATIISIISSNGGRFLKLEDSQWVEIDAAARHERVSNSLRKACIRHSVKESRRAQRSRKAVEQRQAAYDENSVFGRLLQRQQMLFESLLKDAESPLQ